jgi:hypothetical protein
MWCSNCHEDVPAHASAGEAACCARCGQALDHDGSGANSIERIFEMGQWGVELDAATERGTAVAESTRIEDDWLLEQELKQLKRRIGQPIGTPSIEQNLGQQSSLLEPSWRIDQAHLALPSKISPPAAQEQSERRHSPIAWLIMSLGLMTFMCGAVLLGMALLGGRSHLWGLGMPMTLAGQFGLLLGLVLQMDSLWQANRRTTETLDQVDHRLQEINHTTTMLGTTHSAPAQSFYAHMAAGANPQLLLADLKGQLDLLAVRMSGHR